MTYFLLYYYFMQLSKILQKSIGNNLMMANTLKNVDTLKINFILFFTELNISFWFDILLECIDIFRYKYQ